MPDKPSSFSSRAAAVLTVGVLALLVFFTWRVVYYMNQIRTGTVDLSTFKSSSFTPLAHKPTLPPASASLPLERADAPSLGSPGAALHIVEFADFGCPFSKQASSVVRALAAKYPTRLYLTFRHFPITELHPAAERAAEAAECAREQGKFWEYHDKLFINQADQSDAALLQDAQEVGLDASAFQSCLDSGQEAARVKEDMDAGLAAGVSGTPTFFFNGVAVPGAIPLDVFEQIILQATPPAANGSAAP